MRRLIRLTASRGSAAMLLLVLSFCIAEARALGTLWNDSATSGATATGKLRLVAEFDVSPRDAGVVKWDSDSRRVAVAGLFNDAIEVFDVEQKRQVYELKKGRPGSLALAWSPDGRFIAAGIAGTRNFKDRISIFIWDARTGAHLRSITGPFEVTDTGANDPHGLEFSPDGRFLGVSYRALIGRAVPRIFIYDTDRFALHASFGDARIVAASPLVFSPDSRMIAEGTSRGDILVWEVQSRALIRTIKAHAFHISSLAYSADGRWLASATDEKPRGPDGDPRSARRPEHDPVRISSASTGELVATLPVRAGSRRGLHFSSDGAFLAGGGWDNTLKIWRTGTWELIHTAPARYPLVPVAVSPNSRYIAVSGGDGRIAIWQLVK